MVSLPPPIENEQEHGLLERRLDEAGFTLYWGTASEFAEELVPRWEAVEPPRP